MQAMRCLTDVAWEFIQTNPTAHSWAISFIRAIVLCIVYRCGFIGHASCALSTRSSFRYAYYIEGGPGNFPRQKKADFSLQAWFNLNKAGWPFSFLLPARSKSNSSVHIISFFKVDLLSKLSIFLLILTNSALYHASQLPPRSASSSVRFSSCSETSEFPDWTGRCRM